MGVISHNRCWCDAKWNQALSSIPDLFDKSDIRVVATILDNSPASLAIDDWAQIRSWVHVPLPLFFTPDQMRHAISSAGADALIVLPDFRSMWLDARHESFYVLGEELILIRLPSIDIVIPGGTQTITFTSGTTGKPKGVCLAQSAMNYVARSLATAMAPLEIKRHLNALPFAILLEHVAGVRAARIAGADLIVISLPSLGWKGASGFDIVQFHQAVLRYEPHSIVILPQMLRAWCGLLANIEIERPTSLRMVAVGGGGVGASLIMQAQSCGLPVYEGYGLSEGASVQCLNLPGASRPGSVGRPLPHVHLRLASDGELLISGSLMLGYLGDESSSPVEWPTGDLAHIDDDGYVFIKGRKKNILITSFGRNVSPEWVEATLRCNRILLEAVVFGDGQAHLSAVVWPLNELITDEQIQASIDTANKQLPDYARVHQWVRALIPFESRTGMSTPNGRPQRSAIYQAHAKALGFSSSFAEVNI